MAGAMNSTAVGGAGVPDRRRSLGTAQQQPSRDDQRGLGHGLT
jgi:hypothetical protein